MSSARRSKKWPGPASPSRPCSMIRKNGPSAAKSARSAMGAFTMPPLLPRRSGLGGEVGEADRRRAGGRENIAVGLGAATACERLGERMEDLAVLSRHARADHRADPFIAVRVPV